MRLRAAVIACAAVLAVGASCSREEASQAPVGAAAPAEPVLDAAGRALDPATGLVLADGYELVASNCIACHSAQQFLRQRGTRATWQGIIDWMQATQGLWEFPEGVEERIVDYLATHYAPEGEWRRAPIPAHLMPPDPARAQMRELAETVRAGARR